MSEYKYYIDSLNKNNAEKEQDFANKTVRKVEMKIGGPERIQEDRTGLRRP